MHSRNETHRVLLLRDWSRRLQASLDISYSNEKTFGSQRSQSSDTESTEVKPTIQEAKHSVSKRRLEMKILPTLCAPSASVSELCAPCLGWSVCEIFRRVPHDCKI